MSLNFKLLKRSFSLRNNATDDDKEDKKVSNLLKESIGFNYTPSKSKLIQFLSITSVESHDLIGHFSSTHLRLVEFTILSFFPFTEINSSSDVSSYTRELSLKPFDAISIIDLHTEAFNIEMEYFIPYARLKNVPQNGMQLATVKRNNEQVPSANATSVVSANVVSSKKIQKHVLNQQFNDVKGSEFEFSPTKMSKKQLKVAQDQLKKLNKINIHLSGK